MTGDEQDNMAGGAGGDPFSGFSEFWKRARGGNAAGGRGKSQQFDEDFFEDFESFFNMGGEGRQTRQMKGQDIHVHIELNFMDAVNGAKKEINIDKKGVCTTCHGSKCKPGTSATKCNNCGGRGTVNYRQGPMVIQMACNYCKGAGTTIKNPCATCRGSGISNVKVKEEVVIPKGINNGQNLRFSGKVNQMPFGSLFIDLFMQGNVGENQGAAGDLIVKVSVKPDPYFKREGYDIYTEAYITIAQVYGNLLESSNEMDQAVLGTTVEVKTLQGTRRIQLNEGIQHGEKRKLSGLGITKLAPQHHEKGDHYVVFKITVPKTLSQKQKELYSQLQKLEEEITISGRFFRNDLTLIIFRIATK